jgi:hypothetical protein
MTASEIDDAILASIETRWQKVAMVISRAAKKLYGELPDGEEAYKMIGDRVEVLVQSGRIKARGDVTRWRFSQISKA